MRRNRLIQLCRAAQAALDGAVRQKCCPSTPVFARTGAVSPHACPSDTVYPAWHFALTGLLISGIASSNARADLLDPVKRLEQALQKTWIDALEEAIFTAERDFAEGGASVAKPSRSLRDSLSVRVSGNDIVVTLHGPGGVGSVARAIAQACRELSGTTITTTSGDSGTVTVRSATIPGTGGRVQATIARGEDQGSTIEIRIPKVSK